MSEDEKKGVDEPKGVDLVQMEEDMEESRMDRILETLREFKAEKKAMQAKTTPEDNPPPPSAP